MMGLVGIAGVCAIVGGAIYIYITVGSLLWGKRLERGAASAQATPIPLTAPSSVAVQSYGSMGFAAPGTFVLAMVFLVSFVLYYRSEEHTSELQSLMRISYAVFCLKKQT